MAQPTNTFDSYDAIGNREDLINIIYDISPVETPFLSTIARSTAENILHEWQTDTLAAAADNFNIDGDDTTGTALTPTARIQNYCQISKKAAVISGSQKAARSAGRSNEMEYQVAKQSKELKRDMETALLANKGYVVGSSVVARQLRGLPSWYTNANAGVGGANGTTTTGRTDGTQRVFTELLLEDVLTQIFDDGGNPNVLMVGSFNKKQVKDFLGSSTTKFADVENKTVTASVDLYISDYGNEIKVVPNRFQRARDAHVIQSDMFATAYYRPFMVEDLAKTGDSQKKQIVVEYTLESRNIDSSGIVADLTTS